MTPDLKVIASEFKLVGDFIEAVPYGFGHINDTYLLKTRLSDGNTRNSILQCINQQVFHEPIRVMENMVRVTQHLRAKIVAAGGDPLREGLTVIATKNGRFYHKTKTGEYWRALVFIEGAIAYQHAPSLDYYYEAALTYGCFQRMLSDFPVELLHVTIPDFHHTGKRLLDFETAVAKDVAQRAQFVKKELDFILARRANATLLTDFQAAGKIPLRVTHNDTKIDNVMIDARTGKGLCMIDLDTVMPGIALFDFADSVRSGSNSAAEDEPDLTRVHFEISNFEHLAHGFLDGMRGHLTAVEIDQLVPACHLITYEQAIRFLSDYLNGDTYYKTNHAAHNLDRCRTQIKLLAEMETAVDQMQNIIKKYRQPCCRAQIPAYGGGP